MKKKSLLLLLLFILLLSACSDNSSSESDNSSSEKVMKIGTGITQNHFLFEAVEEFKENVESKTNGEIKVELYHSGQIGDDVELLNAITAGTAHGTMVSPSKLASFIPEMEILGLPFMFPDYDVTHEVIDGPLGQELLDGLEESGYKGLGYFDFGFRHVTNNKHPINEVEDFKNLKLRTMESEAHIEAFEELKANPSPLPFSELFSSLQQGVMDGQENPLVNIYANKLHEVQEYLTLTSHVNELTVFVISDEFYKSLSPEHQDIIDEAGKMAIDYTREAVVQEDELALEEMEKEGIIINELNSDERNEMVDIVQSVNDKYGESINKELYERLLDEIRENSN